jgi:hypothetical protein
MNPPPGLHCGLLMRLVRNMRNLYKIGNDPLTERSPASLQRNRRTHVLSHEARELRSPARKTLSGAQCIHHVDWEASPAACYAHATTTKRTDHAPLPKEQNESRSPKGCNQASAYQSTSAMLVKPGRLRSQRSGRLSHSLRDPTNAAEGP